MLNEGWEDWIKSLTCLNIELVKQISQNVEQTDKDVKYDGKVKRYEEYSGHKGVRRDREK